MSGDSEMSSIYQSSSDPEEGDSVESEDEDIGVVYAQITPYQDEPLAEEDDEENGERNEEEDLDGLTPAVLEARYEREVSVESWCQCDRCSDQHLVGALEFRCCREVVNASAKMTFDGSIERIKCITRHDDYSALTNRTVLLQVAPLLKDKDGRSYRRRSGVSENEFIRAAAYRWTVRWLCGYMGWENTRPLPACIYQDLRTRYPTPHTQSRGYKNS
ncbi:uncharacterized protein [Montipora foliosa]|uniref:uncharacterized protein n=1 Tax=Montipora foliosa TaxID=591990 RepID=UPI0035F1E242